MKKLFPVLFIFVITNTTGCSFFKGDIIKDEHQTSPLSILNHEDTSVHCYEEIKKNHFRLHIKLQQPVAILYSKPIIPGIYAIAGIRGTSTFKVCIDRTGKAKSYTLIKSSGLGLDEAAITILKSIKFTPLYRIGLREKSIVNISITFSPGDE